MGVCSRCVWPFITLVVIIVAVVVYFFYPPFCTNTGAECPYTKDSSTTPSSSSPTPSSPAVPRIWESDFHLPTNIIPSFYSIFVMPDLVTGRFTGTVTISLDISSPADHLLVNIDGLTVTSTRLSKGTSKVPLRDTFAYSPNQFWVILPEEVLAPEAYSLYLEFSGSLTKDIVGLYMTNYTDPTSGETR